jgi:hypothetical protein
MRKNVLLIVNILFPFIIFSQTITSISPNQGSQGQQVPLIISGNNMSFTGWSCWSQTSNVTQFRFTQWSATNTFYGVSTSSVGQQLNGYVDIDPSQPVGVYHLQVLNCTNVGWIQFMNSFQVNLPTWDCDGQGNCLDPGTGQGTYASLSACQSSCVVVTQTWDCDGLGNCLDPGTGNGTYASLSACQANCIVVTPTWDCEPSTGICSDPGTGNGTYASLSACQANCNNVSVEEIGLTNFKIFPNPSSELFNISFSSNRVQDLRIRILNNISKEVMIIELNQYKGKYTKQINLTNNAKGIYFLEIETTDGIINKKLILQ